jgi:hypothetical protein
MAKLKEDWCPEGKVDIEQQHHSVNNGFHGLPMARDQGFEE